MRSERTPTSRAADIPAPHAVTSVSSSEAAGLPSALRDSFAEFRRAHSPGTRIPDDLRQSVLEALDRGASISAMRRELGLTSSQLVDWTRHRHALSNEVLPSGPIPPARVFGLQETATDSEQSGTPESRCESLELRLGCWSVVIRSSCS